MNLTHEVQSKLARVVLQRGFDFLEAVLKMDRRTIEGAAALGVCSEDQAKVINTFIRDRVFDSIPVSKVRLEPIETR
jgi:hypothetical protein